MKKYLLIFMVFLCWLCVANTVRADYSSKVIDNNGTWTGEIHVPKGYNLNVSIHPNSNSDLTVTLQRKLPGDVTWRNVDTWILTGVESDKEHITRAEAENAYYRLGCDTVTDYTSGNCTCRIGKDY